MIDDLLILIAPHPCISCGKIEAVLCSNCKYDIVKGAHDTCLFCNRVHPDSENAICSTTWFVGDRKAVLQRLVGIYKFNGVRAARFVLAALLYSTAPHLPRDAVVVWIPSNPKHIRERGYDHMRLLAAAFAKKAQLTIRPLLKRQTYFVQHRSDRKTRLNQVVGAFTVTERLDKHKTYLLLDDIYTTGATVKEALKVLIEAGAGHVIVAVIARQPLD